MEPTSPARPSELLTAGPLGKPLAGLGPWQRTGGEAASGRAATRFSCSGGSRRQAGWRGRSMPWMSGGGLNKSVSCALERALLVLPWWLRGKELACPSRRHRFDLWSGTISSVMEPPQAYPWACAPPPESGPHSLQLEKSLRSSRDSARPGIKGRYAQKGVRSRGRLCHTEGYYCRKAGQPPGFAMSSFSKTYSSIWPCWVLAVACRIFVVARGL